MSIPYSAIDYAMERDLIEGIYQSAALFEHSEIFVPADGPAANDDPYDDYENLYLVPD